MGSLIQYIIDESSKIWELRGRNPFLFLSLQLQYNFTRPSLSTPIEFKRLINRFEDRRIASVAFANDPSAHLSYVPFYG